MSNIRVRVTKPHPYVVVEPNREGPAFHLKFTTHELDNLNDLIEALIKAKDLLLQAKRAA